MKTIEIKPANGGRLLPGLSADNISIADYGIKRDWRRVLDAERRAEGYDKFRLNPALSAALQATLPTAGKVTVIAQATLASGRSEVIAGTATTLYKCNLENGDYYDSDYFDGDYFETNTGIFWVKIGDGFSAGGKRWEVVTVGNYLALNNGVDLPVTYRVGEDAVKPIYELREQGIASIGTIAEQNGILVCADIRQIEETKFAELMATIPAAVEAQQVGIVAAAANITVNNGTAGVEGRIAKATAAAFTPDMVGKDILLRCGLRATISSVQSVIRATLTIPDTVNELCEPAQPFYVLSATDTRITPDAATLFPDIAPADLVGRRLFWESGDVREVVGINGGYIIVESELPIAAGKVAVENSDAYKRFTDATYIQRRQFRVLPSMPQAPRRFGAVFTASTTKDSKEVVLGYPCRSLPELVNESSTAISLLILGAGEAGANLTADIQSIDTGIAGRLTLSEPAKTTRATATDDTTTKADETNTTTLLEAADAAASFAGVYQDLEDDGSAIVKMLTLRNLLVIYKKTAIAYLATYTGQAEAPFSYEKVSFPGSAAALHFSNSLVSIGGLFHIYAGREGFYQFDLSSRVPREMPVLQPCQRLFFEQAANDDDVFTAENALTREIFFCFKSAKADRALCYDYVYGTARTTSAEMQSAATIYKPGTSEQWFVMGGNDGKLFRYGLLAGPVEESGSITGSTAKVADLKDEDTIIVTGNNDFNGTYTWRSAHSLYANGGYVEFMGAYQSTISNGVISGNFSDLNANNEIPGRNIGTFIYQIAEIGYPFYAAYAPLVPAVESEIYIVASGAIFSESSIGKSIQFSGGKIFAITEYITPKIVAVLGSGSVTGETFKIIPAIWHRDGVAYDSVLQSGADAFGSAHSEKTLTEWVLLLGDRSPNTPLTVALRGGRNPAEMADVQTTAIPSPNTRNLKKPTLMRHFLGDRVTASGINNPCEITGKIISLVGAGSHSFNRR